MKRLYQQPQVDEVVSCTEEDKQMMEKERLILQPFCDSLKDAQIAEAAAEKEWQRAISECQPLDERQRKFTSWAKTKIEVEQQNKAFQNELRSLWFGDQKQHQQQPPQQSRPVNSNLNHMTMGVAEMKM